jgi:hypothetical protein
VRGRGITTTGFVDHHSDPEPHPSLFISIGFFCCISKFYTLAPFDKEFFYLGFYNPSYSSDRNSIPHPNTMDTIRLEKLSGNPYHIVIF